MEKSIEFFAFITFTVTGISHILHHKEWAEFIVNLRTRGTLGVFLHGMVILLFGSFIVSFHPVWKGPAAVLTIVGYLMVAKGIMIFTSPALGLRSLSRVNPEKSIFIAVPGIIKLIVAGCAGWELWN